MLLVNWLLLWFPWVSWGKLAWSLMHSITLQLGWLHHKTGAPERCISDQTCNISNIGARRTIRALRLKSSATYPSKCHLSSEYHSSIITKWIQHTSLKQSHQGYWLEITIYFPSDCILYWTVLSVWFILMTFYGHPCYHFIL